jgi:hypothetical protein
MEFEESKKNRESYNAAMKKTIDLNISDGMVKQFRRGLRIFKSEWRITQKLLRLNRRQT